MYGKNQYVLLISNLLKLKFSRGSAGYTAKSSVKGNKYPVFKIHKKTDNHIKLQMIKDEFSPKTTAVVLS